MEAGSAHGLTQRALAALMLGKKRIKEKLKEAKVGNDEDSVKKCRYDLSSINQGIARNAVSFF